MEIISFIISLATFVLAIIIIVKFFSLCDDVRFMRTRASNNDDVLDELRTLVYMGKTEDAMTIIINKFIKELDNCTSVWCAYEGATPESVIRYIGSDLQSIINKYSQILADIEYTGELPEYLLSPKSFVEAYLSRGKGIRRISR